jgi:hypothetical protein
MARKIKARTRSNDRAAVQNQKVEAVADAWSVIRSRYDADLVAEVEAVMDNGFTMADLLRLEMLEHLKCGRLIEEYSDEDRTTKLVGTLASVKLQCRKHMRNIMANMGPALNAQSMPVVIPEGLSVADLDELDMEPDEILS